MVFWKLKTESLNFEDNGDLGGQCGAKSGGSEDLSQCRLSFSGDCQKELVEMTWAGRRLSLNVWQQESLLAVFDGQFKESTKTRLAEGTKASLAN